MKVTNTDLKNLGIKYIQTDNSSNVVAVSGKVKAKNFKKDIVVNWEDIGLDHIVPERFE